MEEALACLGIVVNIFQQYEIEFKEMVEAAYRASRKRAYSTDNAFAKTLLDMVRKLRNTRRSQIEKRDIEQQLALLWLEWHRLYRSKTGRKVRLRNYLLRRSVWGLRNWLRKEMSGPRPVSLADFKSNPKARKHLFDLHWLLFGDKEEDGPLFMLTAYERYLLYMRHVQGLYIDEVAKIVHKNRKTVMKSLVEIISKIRSHSNAEANTGGSCSRGDGLQANPPEGADRFSGD